MSGGIKEVRQRLGLKPSVSSHRVKNAAIRRCMPGGAELIDAIGTSATIVANAKTGVESIDARIAQQRLVTIREIAWRMIVPVLSR